MAGELDNPARNQPSRDKLESLGIETGLKVYPGAKHGCWNRLPWFNEMANDIDEFLARHLK
jgi:alpha-beta hydrolase superfamily lysophospholipase